MKIIRRQKYPVRLLDLGKQVQEGLNTAFLLSEYRLFWAADVHRHLRLRGDYIPLVP